MKAGFDKNTENIIDSADVDYKKKIEEDDSGVKERESLTKSVVDIIVYIIIMVALVLFIVTFVVQKVQVSGNSMNDTLCNNEQLILEKLTYRFGDPARFDIVVFRPFETEKRLYYIKRVIGLPGETIQITGGKIYINSEVLEEDYGKEKMIEAGIAEKEIKLGEDEYFLLGDNRNHSKDSRFDDVGIVKRRQISGRALLRIWPLDKIGILKHQ